MYLQEISKNKSTKMSKMIDAIALLLLIINFYYMISFDIVGFFLYI